MIHKLSDTIALELERHNEESAFHDIAAWKLKGLLDLINKKSPDLLSAKRSYASVSMSTGLLMLICSNASGKTILTERDDEPARGWCVYRTYMEGNLTPTVDPSTESFYSELKDAFRAFLQLRQQ